MARNTNYVGYGAGFRLVDGVGSKEKQRDKIKTLGRRK